MVRFTDPQVVLFVRSPEQAARFYATLGFVETFRTAEADPVKIEMAHGGFALGLATHESAREEHGIDAGTEPNRAVVVLWTDDARAAYDLATRAGARAVREPHAFRGTLRIAFVEDLDGHSVHFVQRVESD